MKRDICISNQFVSYKPSGSATLVASDNIDSIVNYSVDSIVCLTAEYIDDSQLDHFVSNMVAKLRDNGSITIHLVNFKHIFMEYINQHISANTVFNNLKNKKNIVSPDRILQLFNKCGLSISKIDQKDENFIIIAHKQSR